jgi:hypothetical protein
MYPSKGYKFPQKLSCYFGILYALQPETQLGKLDRGQLIEQTD